MTPLHANAHGEVMLDGGTARHHCTEQPKTSLNKRTNRPAVISLKSSLRVCVTFSFGI